MGWYRWTHGNVCTYPFLSSRLSATHSQLIPGKPDSAGQAELRRHDPATYGGGTTFLSTNCSPNPSYPAYACQTTLTLVDDANTA